MENGESSYAKALSAAEAAAPKHLSGEAVAIVDGTPITKSSYNHQLEVSAPTTIKSLISDPSDYSACVAATKGREEKTQKLAKAEEERYAKKLKGRKSPGLFGGARKPRTEAEYKLQCEQQYKAEREQAVRTLINRVWTNAQAKELGVSANENEVAKQVKTREEAQKRIAKTARNSEFGGIEANYNKTDLTEMVKSEVLETQIYKKIREKFAKPGSVSQEKLEKYFNEHKQLYAESERRSITYASTKSKSVAEAVAKERGGLTAAAGKHGIKAITTSISCAQVGSIKEGLLPKICATKTGEIGGPITPTTNTKVPANYYVFEVKSITPATKPSFAQAKERIKQALSSQGEELGMSKYEEESRTKRKEKTECAAGYVVELCKEYVTPKPRTLSK